MLAVLMAHAGVPAAARAQENRLAAERIVLRTIAGDLQIALFNDAAPNNVAQLLALARTSGLDTTSFVPVAGRLRVPADDREQRLTAEQSLAARPLSPEFNGLRRIRGSVVRASNGANAEDLFSILTTDAADDRSLVVVGFVEKGLDVLDALANAPRGPDGAPIVRMSIDRAEAVNPIKLEGMVLAPARAVTAESGRAATRDRLHATEVWPVAGGLALMIALGIVTVALSPRLPRRALNALALLNVLIAAFLLLIILTPPAQRRAWLAVAIFAGLIGLFKLMGRFEAPER